MILDKGEKKERNNPVPGSHERGGCGTDDKLIAIEARFIMAEARRKKSQRLKRREAA